MVSLPSWSRHDCLRRPGRLHHIQPEAKSRPRLEQGGPVMNHDYGLSEVTKFSQSHCLVRSTKKYRLARVRTITHN